MDGEITDYGKDIIQRNMQNGKFNLANAFMEQEKRILALEEAMTFFSNWYNKTHRTEILIPEHLKDK